MTELLLAVGIVVFTSAMCSLFEAVLYAVPVSHVEKLAAAGRGSGLVLKRLRDHVDRPITAILSLNTISNTAGAALAGALANEALGRPLLAYFSAACTLCILVFSEVLPKTIGVVYARPLAALVAYPLRILVWIFAPFIWILRSLTHLVARQQGGQAVSDEEIISMVRLGSRSGDFQPHESRVIQNVLALESKVAHDIMTPRTVVFSFDANETVERAVAQKTLLNYSRVPIYDNDPEHVIGLVHRRDVFRAVAENRAHLAVKKIMRPVNFVVETLPLDQLLREFLEKRKHLMVVLDEYGGMAGIVTLEDVVEEILGREIVDEFDQVEDLREHAQDQKRETLELMIRAEAERAAAGEPTDVATEPSPEAPGDDGAPPQLPDGKR